VEVVQRAVEGLNIAGNGDRLRQQDALVFQVRAREPLAEGLNPVALVGRGNAATIAL